MEFHDADLRNINPTARTLAALYPLLWCAIIAYVVFLIAHPQWICYPLMRKAEDRYVAAAP